MGLYTSSPIERVAAVAPGATVKVKSPTILSFARVSSSAEGRAKRKDLLRALRFSASPVIVDFSGCSTLHHEDIRLLLDCLALVAARDTKVLLVAGSPVNRLLLEVTRISSLATVLDSVTEALAYPQIPAESDSELHAAKSKTGSA